MWKSCHVFVDIYTAIKPYLMWLSAVWCLNPSEWRPSMCTINLTYYNYLFSYRLRLWESISLCVGLPTSLFFHQIIIKEKWSDPHSPHFPFFPFPSHSSPTPSLSLSPSLPSSLTSLPHNVLCTHSFRLTQFHKPWKNLDCKVILTDLPHQGFLKLTLNHYVKLQYPTQ